MNKSIYDLKQAAKKWYEELANFLIQQNLVRSKNDYWLPFQQKWKGKKLFVLSWIDDLVIGGSSSEAMEELRKTLETKFKMDDRGKLEWFLGMQKNEDSEKITLDQETYIESVLEKFSTQGSNPSKTPAENNLKLVKASEVTQLVDETLYRSLVGSLLYIAKQTGPDIVCIVNALSRFMDKPANSHWLAGKRVLRYLQATKSPKLVYPRDSDYNLIGESDADWSGDHDDIRFFLQTGIQWGSSQLANQEAADSGSLFLWSRISGFGCSCSRSHLLEITDVWNGLPADAGNSDWWRQPELHQTGYQPCYA